MILIDSNYKSERILIPLYFDISKQQQSHGNLRRVLVLVHNLS